MRDTIRQTVLKTLDRFEIEVTSWGFTDTGTRFGKFRQAAAATTLGEKFHDAGVVHSLTGIAPSMGLHVQWDLTSRDTPRDVVALAGSHGMRIGSINPNLFQDQCYKFGSFCSPSADAREAAMDQVSRSIEFGAASGSKYLSVWLGDGTNYPGQDDIRRRKHHAQRAFREIHLQLDREWPDAMLLVEYKPFEPAFYHTDIADWGMSYVFSKAAGPRAKVLIDTGHHLPGCNIEHIVAFLLDEGMLGGFHFNDRKYADDDLTIGSIDPYAVFRIFDQIAQYEFETGSPAPIAYTIDQSHNIKPKLEATVQTVCEAQKLFAKAAAVDRTALAEAQAKGDVVGAETVLRRAFEADLTPLLVEWRRQRGLPPDPLEELRASGLLQRLASERGAGRETVADGPKAGA